MRHNRKASADQTTSPENQAGFLKLDYLLITGSLLGRVYLFALGSLLLWAIAPVVLGWQGSVVMSGSMMPVVSAGDVLVTQKFDPSTVKVGQILVVRDPNRPGQRLSHRYVSTDEAGLLVLKGDANRTEDSTRVAPENVLGLTRLVIPYVGLPKLWLETAEYAKFAAMVLISGLAIALVATGEVNPRPEKFRIRQLPSM